MAGPSAAPAPVEAHFKEYLGVLGFNQKAAELHAEALALDAHAAPKAKNWRLFGAARKAVMREQLVYRFTGIDIGEIDGLVGPQTRYAREAYQHWQVTGSLPTWRDADPSYVDQPRLPLAPNVWPREKDCTTFYGAPGVGNGAEKQLVYVQCPWRLTLAWDARQHTERIRIHKRCAPRLERVLDRVFAHYGEKEIRRLRLHLYGGSYAPRTKRGGTSWSMHAYGCAIDFDPGNNPLSMRAPQAPMSRPDYDMWWEIWESEGWVSLGRARGFDWMHLQAAQL